jgi:L-asparaginase/Glu-tRNA(Gln) amidotransferase subunit D
MKIKVLITGGTIDKVYNASTGEFLSSAESGNIIQLKTDIFSRKVLAGCVWMMYHKQSMMKMAIVNCKLNWIKIPISY